MSDLTKTLAMPTVTLEAGGKTYTLKPFAIEDYGAVEAWLEDNAWAASRRALKRGAINPGEYEKVYKSTLSLIAGCELTYGTETYASATMTLPGLQVLLRLAIPELEEKDAFDLVRKHTSEVMQAILANHEVSQ